MRHSKT
jgi:immunoglobulin-binding protein 1